MGEKRPKEAHDRAEVESLHLSLRWSGSWLIPCAGCLGEAQARSPLESQAFACSADQEQRAHCWLEGNSLAAFRMGSRWTIPFGEARHPYSQPLCSLLLSPQPLGMQKLRRDSFPSPSLPSEVENPLGLGAKRLQAAQSSPADAVLLQPSRCELTDWQLADCQGPASSWQLLSDLTSGCHLLAHQAAH